MTTGSANLQGRTAATPLMQQYLGIKQRYPDEILFFRLGDFYEMFFEDAVRAAPLLEVALTQRQSIPMCGVPYHAMTGYLSKLIKAGVSVAVAEQLEDPKKTKGMVKRDVVRVVTPGTLVEDELLPSKANNFLVAVEMSVNGKASCWALAATDVSTGRQWAGELENDLHWNELKAHIAALSPSEILLIGEAAKLSSQINTGRAVVRFEPPFALRATGGKPGVVAAIQRYLERDHPEALKSLRPAEPLPMASTKTMFLDETAIRHLELVQSTDPGKAGPTLISILDQCVTPLGSRLLRWWLLHPSLDLAVINERLDQVEELVENSMARSALRGLFKGVADIERISVRAQAGTASPRDLEALRQSLDRLPEVEKLFSGDLPHNFVPLPGRGGARGGATDGTLAAPQETPPLPPPLPGRGSGNFYRLLSQLQVPTELTRLLAAQLSDAPPAKLTEGGVIRDGMSAELDELRGLRRRGKQWIAQMEAVEREKTGIGSLKVGYNDIFGYFIEVSKSNLSKVPADWIRKQTMANGERYITPALKEQEEKILGAEERIRALEAGLYAELAQQVASFGPTLATVAEAMACLDATASLAEVAVQNGFVRPSLNESHELVVKSGQHPVVARQISRDRFIPNDVSLGTEGNPPSPRLRGASRIAVITGPNMAGKSTYLRQNALIVILAQMGSFVPAESATIGLVDKIFTRIGASDRLAQGQSTFMVEMQEVATLLHNSTERSLLILDEVGRGTSTYDGVSIAWAVIEHLSKTGPRTLFATHYFELTQLDGRLPGVFNAHATAKEWPGPDGRRQVVFLYQILPGAADRSYGIHVAETAGLPQDCIDRARAILKQLESGDHRLAGAPSTPSPQLELFGEHPVLEDLRSLHVESMTPIEALNKLSALKEKL